MMCVYVDPVTVAKVQSAIAADEHRHAALAWDVLRWCFDRDPGVASALAAVASTNVAPPPTASGDPTRHGSIAREHCAASRQRLQKLTGLRLP